MTKRSIPRRLQIPVPFRMEQSVGLGDVVKRVTTAVGIKPCGGCQRRAEALNQAVTFQGRQRKP
jgi:hypothetical protein